MTDTSRFRISPLTLFALALAVQIAIIGGIALSASRVSSHGTAAYLKIEPVDPRDPLRGDYMTFAYTGVSSVSAYMDEAAPGAIVDPKAGDIVYLPLRRQGRYWQFTYGNVLSRIPADKDRESGVLYLRGNVKSAYSSNGETKLDIGYGIEEYFIQEGAGGTFPTTGEFSARISVAENGNSVLEQLYVNGKEWP